MGENLRVEAESDLCESEKDWGLPVEITYSNGTKQIYKKGSATELLKSLQIQYNTRVLNPDTGEEKVVPITIVDMRISSLDQVPVQGDKLHFRIPGSPNPAAAKIDMVSTPTRPHESSSGLGHMRFYLQRIEQL